MPKFIGPTRFSFEIFFYFCFLQLNSKNCILVLKTKQSKMWIFTWCTWNQSPPFFFINQIIQSIHHLFKKIQKIRKEREEGEFEKFLILLEIKILVFHLKKKIQRKTSSFRKQQRPLAGRSCRVVFRAKPLTPPPVFSGHPSIRSKGQNF